MNKRSKLSRNKNKFSSISGTINNYWKMRHKGTQTEKTDTDEFWNIMAVSIYKYDTKHGFFIFPGKRDIKN